MNPLATYRSLIVLIVAVIMCEVLLSSVLFEHADIGDGYLSDRIRILEAEKAMFVGGDIELTIPEKEANKIILKEKSVELLAAYENESQFLPSQHFFHAKKNIDKSKVFSIIKIIPKGASLHTHLLAAVSADFIIKNITYRENIYGCFLNGAFKLRFLRNSDQDRLCEWKELKEYRKEDVNFNKWLKEQLSLAVDNPVEVYPNRDAVWRRFKKIFTTVYDMLSYRPVFQDYIYQLLNELYADNVMYTELRGTVMPLYELNGRVYDTREFFDIFIETVDMFKKEFPRFLGVRYIHSVYRGGTPDVLKRELNNLTQLQSEYPNFIAGFDFVGYEEEGKQIVDFHEVLLEKSEELKFYFHAGETNWYGHTDLNMVDAVLLNSSRIGHGFALPKHPILMDMVKSKGIPIEVCPISNQVLKLNEDPRNHPAVSLLANDIPVVICNDDPSAWGATGLSYDWYVAFMAMTPECAGIKVLKQFAMNSIRYSAMTEQEKETALVKWNLEWKKFLDIVLSQAEV